MARARSTRARRRATDRGQQVNGSEEFLIVIIGITCSVAVGLFSLLVVVVSIIALLLLSRYAVRTIATIRHRRQRTKQAAQDVDTIAEAIALAAGHNWTADMMPQYRADFRRQAAAALAAFKTSRGLK